TGTGPLGGSGWLDRLAIPGVGDMLAINPGVEGLAADVGGTRVLLLPHELVAPKLLSPKRPAEAVPDFAKGGRPAGVGPTRGARGSGSQRDGERAGPVSHRHLRRGRGSRDPDPAVSGNPSGAPAHRPGAARGGAAGRPLPGRPPRPERPLHLRA